MFILAWDWTGVGIVLFPWCFPNLSVQIVEEPDILDQADVPRLGEIDNNSPRVSTRALTQAESFRFEWVVISLRREQLA